jgi:hypothetical protein
MSQQVSEVSNRLMDADVNVQRIMRTGTVWFSVAVGSTALVVAAMIMSGWRPGELPPLLDGLWWLGALTVGLSIGLLGWSGCPILEVDVETANRNKTKTMQLGTMLFIVGGAVTVAAVLIAPVG